ncbi:MAG: hypothetical protein ACXVZP_01480 [Gaiellaceae bacterium]
MLQWSSALLILAAGAIHLCLWFDYFRTVHVVGTLLLLNFLAGSAIALALLVRAAALVVLAAIGRPHDSCFGTRPARPDPGPMARPGTPSSGRAARCR